MKVAVGFSPRMRVERFSVAERRLNRSKTALAVVHASLRDARFLVHGPWTKVHGYRR